MENRIFRYVIVILFALGLSIGNTSFAYEIDTHAYLTSEAVRLYNQTTSDNTISDTFKSYILDGSKREDDLPRPENHFYDPINNRGLSGSFSGESAKQWAQDKNAQNKIDYQANNKTDLAKLKPFYPTADFTWNTAIKYWLDGHKEMAMESLGHILHLMEDMGVPEHVRNESHTRGSLYEQYALRYTLAHPDNQLQTRIGDKKPIILDNLGSYFDELATYTNKYFYSPGTIIYSIYQLPDAYAGKEEIKGGWQYFLNKDDEGNEYYLATQQSIDDANPITEGYLTMDNSKVKESYWDLLSVRSVRYSAGVIDLFFRDAEKAKADPSILDEKKSNSGLLDTLSAIPGQVWGGMKHIAVTTGSFLGSVFNSIKSGVASVSGFVGGLFTNDNGLTDAGSVDVSGSNSVNTGGNSADTANKVAKASAAATKKDALAKKNDEIAALKLQIAGLQKDAQAQDKTVLQLEKKQVDVPVATSTEQVKPLAIKKTSTSAPVCPYGSGNGVGQRTISINEVAWMGGVRSASDEWIELKNISGSDVDVSGWQLDNKGGGIKAYLSGIKNPVIKPGQFVLLERTDNNSVVGISDDLIYSGALGNTNDGLKLFSASCGVVDEVAIGAKWPAGDNASKQTMERDLSGYGWHTSSLAGGTPKKENSNGVSYPSGGGGSIAASNISVQTQDSGSKAGMTVPVVYPKVLITEVQLASASSTHDEFVTLYNPNGVTVDLTGWYVQKKTKTAVDFSTFAKADLFIGKQIAPHGFFTIAHPSSTTAYDVVSDYGIADDNTLVLKNPNGDSVDKVGWGAAGDCEGTCAANPPGGQSIKRTFVQGSFVDTDNNAHDFELLALSQNIPDQSNDTTTFSPSSQLIKDAVSGSLSVMSYYQSLATSTAYTIRSFSMDGSGIAGKWKGGVCEFNPAIPQCTTVLAQTFADTDMPGGDGDVLLTFGFSSPAVLDTGKQYALFVQPTGEVPVPARISRVRGSVADVYFRGSLSAFGQYAPVYISERVDPGLADMYFEINAATTTQPSIDILATTTTATSTATTTATTTPQFYPIVINEIMYDLPGADDGREWIELYNNGTSSVDIAPWRLNEGGTNHLLNIKQGASTLPAGGYVILANDSTKFLADHSGFSGSIFDSAFSLSNDGEPVTLKNGDLVIDTVTYASSTGASGDGKSLQKFSDGWHAASSTPGVLNALPVVIVIDSAAITGTATTTATTTAVQPFVLSQSINDIRSNYEQAARYVQGIGTNAINMVRSFQTYVDSDDGVPWDGGICKIPGGNSSACLDNIVASARVGGVAAAGIKTLLTFDFGAPQVLDSQTQYAFYIKPVAGMIWPHSSVYGSSGDSYAGGKLWDLVKYDSFMQGTPGIADMYFAINSQ